MTIEDFDYIVIGAGSAGCGVAARLSESRHHTVLVLEAGGRDSNPWIHIPIGFSKTFFDETLNWCFSTEASSQLHARKLFAPCGKVLGGSSSINGQVYVRGHRDDFDDWARAGNSGWGYDDVLPFFRKSEDQQRGANHYHGSGGPLSVSDLVDFSPLGQAFVESGVAGGLDRNDDFNGPSQEGTGFFQVTVRNGRRASSAAAFLRDAERRSNVCLKTNAEVERLMIESGRVTEVRYGRGGESLVARARRAVVLCAGALNSPAILQRSGIGRGEWLQAAGIAVRHELPGVGANLQDHVQARLALRSRRHATLNTQTRQPLRLVGMGLKYALFRRGPLTFAGGQCGAFVRSHPKLDRSDTLLILMPFSSADYRKGLDEFPGFTITSCLMRPESRGTVRVRSPAAKDPPVIQPNYLEAESDRRAMVAGLRAARHVAATKPLRDEIEREERPGLNVNSDEELLDYIRATATSVYHPAGTCRMGSDADAVVDSKLRVRGLEGLAVADTSIMPTIVTAPTNAAAIMIGERAAPFLLTEA
ncbi:MAG TPA: GMC family oxidoreductase N-terminal domain-containing protein [Candidatus Acidoferrales bacterium]|nr:GMC family oxidoreductase N-terminal domain-containing protein [Candidatus Acidoferrales bacterium]